MYGLGGKEKPFVPIFGCRKRQQRHAAYANPDDLSTLPSSNSEISNKHNASQISMSSDFDCFDVPMMDDEKPPVTKKQFMHEQKPNQHQRESKFQHEKPRLTNSFSDRTLYSKTRQEPNTIPSFQKQQTFQSRSGRTFVDQQRSEPQNSYPRQGSSLTTMHRPQDLSSSSSSSSSRKPFSEKTNSYQGNNIQRSNDFGNNGFYQNSKPSSSKYIKTKKDDSMMDISSTNNKSVLIKNNKSQSLAPRFVSSRIGDIKKWSDIVIVNDEASQIVFELAGILDSTISYHLPGVEKKFTLKDSSGTMRCVFWEMDRKIQQLRRGSLIRCVGRMTNNSIFHCVSVRAVAPSEQSTLQKFQHNCQQYLHKRMNTFNEV